VQQLLTNLPALILLLAVLGSLVYAGIRIGLRFLLRRLAGLIFVIFGVTFITFILGYITPGNVVDVLCGDKCPSQDRIAISHQYGFDLPWYEQYGRFLNNLLHFNLGISYVTRGQPVWDLIRSALPISVQLGLTSLVLALVIGIPIGVLAGVRAGTRFDTTSMGVALLLFALPTFVTIPFFQLLMRLLFLNHLPYLSPVFEGNPADWIAPIGLLALLELGAYSRLSRTTMLDVLNQDYIRTARAKGLRERTVIVRHAFRNALVPLVTAIGPAVAFVVAGAFFTERLFNIPGIGFASVNAVANKDTPVLQATVILIALAVALMNLMVDVAYGILDPRIKVA
jgi:ABC-type dipeptide/oligopeptide/nickel transport system permease component